MYTFKLVGGPHQAKNYHFDCHKTELAPTTHEAAFHLFYDGM